VQGTIHSWRVPCTYCLFISIVGQGTALGKARAALVLSMSRQVLFMIPLLLTLPLIFGVNGVWLAFPVADILSFALAIWYISKNKSYFIPQKGDLIKQQQVEQNQVNDSLQEKHVKV
jgi:Na+-driven multidrug efflux pump